MANDDDWDDDYYDDTLSHWFDDDDGWDDDGYDGYEPTAVNPGTWLIVGSILVAAVVMFCFLPTIVYWHKQKQSEKKQVEKKLEMVLLDAGITPGYHMMGEETTTKIRKVKASTKTIVRMDRETKRLLQYALPFTVASAVSAVLSSIVLALIGHFVGTKELAAVAVMDILLGIMGEFLEGPLAANTVLCSQAVGCSNNFLAGQYIQLSLIFYFVLQIPLLVVFFLFTQDIILLLGWGDEHVAFVAQQYVRIYIWSEVVDSLIEAVGNLLETTGHEIFTTVMGVMQEVVVVVVIGILVLANVPLTIQIVAWICLAASLLFLLLTLAVAGKFGWLKPFEKGIFRNFALNNGTAVANMLKVAPPLSIGSVLSNAEWAILTAFASYLGPAEVAAWAILGQIWELFECTIEGLGDAAEIRVAYHLGNNHPYKAKLSAYKSLYLGAIKSVFVCGIMLCLLPYIPEFFTVDETLQGMIAECLPLTVVGSLLMTLGILAWYMIGAQGRYKLGTWVMFISSWGITLPLAAVSTYVLHVDLQGLTTAVVLGYVAVGASLLYVLLTSNWIELARKVQIRNSAEKSEEDGEAMYAALQARRSRAARAVCTGNIKLLTAPAGTLGIGIGMSPERMSPVVTVVFQTSPFRGMVFPGDGLISVDGVSVLSLTTERIYEIIKENENVDRQITIEMLTPYHFKEDETSEGQLRRDGADIADFEEEEMILPGWWEESTGEEEGPTLT